MNIEKLTRHQKGDMDIFEAYGFQGELMQEYTETFRKTVVACRNAFNQIAELIEDGEPEKARAHAETVIRELDASAAKSNAFTASLQAGWTPPDEPPKEQDQLPH